MCSFGTPPFVDDSHYRNIHIQPVQKVVGVVGLLYLNPLLYLATEL